ncbi:hypothetical protein [Actinophytocola sp.]|nr:hypothetical protein [Actinophytocola sp.]
MPSHCAHAPPANPPTGMVPNTNSRVVGVTRPSSSGGHVTCR